MMKNIVRNIIILLIPIFFIIIVNEFSRIKMGKPFNFEEKINSSRSFKKKCSWACHNNTHFCKENHVKLLKAYFTFTDKVYFGIINSLQSTGNYGLANILVLVLFIPLLIYFLLLKSIYNFLEIKRLIK